MFEPFVTSKEPGKGTGLGLSTVQSIVTGMGGRIEVLTKIGEGTTFEISMARRFGEVSAQADADAEPQIEGEGRRILLVEDEQAVRFAIGRLLQRLGFAVTMATNGADALQSIEQQTFDLVLTDAVMPGMSGTDLVQHLRTARPDLRVILMSGYTPGAVRSQGGGDAPQRLRKPFTTPDLVRALTLAFAHVPAAPHPIEQAL
jgi:CheY-like chemotaxis protein